MVHNHWYSVVTDDDTLRQGDILLGTRVYWFAQELQPDQDHPPTEWRDGTWIVAQASCDLDTGRSRQALVLPVMEASRGNLRITEGAPQREFKKRLEVLRRGLMPRRFLLAERAEPPKLPLSFVIWDEVAVLPVSYIKTHCTSGSRLRLKAPFREQFGNWVGQRVSAVGPENEALIPEFTRIFDQHVLEADGRLEE